MGYLVAWPASFQISKTGTIGIHVQSFLIEQTRGGGVFVLFEKSSYCESCEDPV